MKAFMALMTLCFVMSAFGQERIILNSETALVNDTEAILIRTSETPSIVKVFFNIPMTRLVCTRRITIRTGRNRRSHCIEYKKVTTNEADKVKIHFKNLPLLGGSEEDTFSIKARQSRLDSENVVYAISTQESVSPYVIKKKGILGYDSYSIEIKNK
jgi:hypothetical protein